jgi:hypothetical protein
LGWQITSRCRRLLPIEAQVEATVLRRVAEASDQVTVICLLGSSDADFVTRLTIDVTGGV